MTSPRVSAQLLVERLGRAPAAVLTFIGNIPTTQVRVVTTIVFVGMTAVRYVLSGIVFDAWEPTIEWLGFLLAALGVDSLHFAAKRVTDASYVAAKQGNGHTPPEPGT